LDWASRPHRVSLCDAASQRRQLGDVPRDAAGYAALFRGLAGRLILRPG